MATSRVWVLVDEEFAGTVDKWTFFQKHKKEKRRSERLFFIFKLFFTNLEKH
jgi:hypothetical protein